MRVVESLWGIREIYRVINQCIHWLRELSWGQTLGLSVALFLVGFFGSIALVAWVLVRLPADYFLDNNHPAAFFWAERHPLLRWSARVLKNLAGIFLVGAGVIMFLPGVPGQGLLTMLIGIMLIDFPGKRRLECSLVRRPALRVAIDRLRRHFGHPPLQLDETSDEKSSRP